MSLDHQNGKGLTKILIGVLIGLSLLSSARAEPRPGSEFARPNLQQTPANPPPSRELNVAECLSKSTDQVNEWEENRLLALVRNTVLGGLKARAAEFSGPNGDQVCRKEFGAKRSENLKALRDQFAILNTAVGINTKLKGSAVLASPPKLDFSAVASSSRPVSGFPSQYSSSQDELNHAQTALHKAVEGCGLTRILTEVKAVIANTRGGTSGLGFGPSSEESREIPSHSAPSLPSQNRETDECGITAADRLEETHWDANIAQRTVVGRLVNLVRQVDEQQKKIAQKKIEAILTEDPLLGFFRTGSPSPFEILQGCRNYGSDLAHRTKELENLTKLNNFRSEHARQLVFFGPAVKEVLKRSPELCSAHNSIGKKLKTVINFARLP